MTEPYYADPWVTLYLGMTRDDYMTQNPASRAVHQSLSDTTRAETRRTTLRRTSPSFAAGATCERTVA